VRALVARIERSDVIVYLEIRHDLRAGVSGGVTWLATTESARLVRAALRPDLRMPDAVSIIAHELQHVVELVERPEVRTNGAMLELYRRIGHQTTQSGKHWDTDAAIAAGTVARLEAIGRSVPPARARVTVGAKPTAARIGSAAGQGNTVAMSPSGFRVMSGTCAPGAG
jgi:hypothetical protein